jgi:YVTN family beta-propeller protein
MATDSRIGTEIAGYRVESVLGRGGMGVVYLAEHHRLNRRVALKLLAPDIAEDPKFRERFVRESQLAASLEHPNIIPIYDAGEDGGLLYIAMRYVEGTDLKSLIATGGPVEPGRAMWILDQVASALDAAHARGLVHRDVKPGNVLLAVAPEMREHVYLSDFGLTKRMSSDSGITGTGQFVGTLDYSAPEQFEGKSLDGRADVYSLGCVVYECLTGEIPYRRDNQAAMVYAHLMAERPKVTERRPQLPGAIDPVVARAMARSPDDRYPTAGTVVDEARAALGLSPVRVAPAIPAGGVPERPGLGPRRAAFAGARLAVAGTLVLALAVGAILLLNGGGSGGEGTGTQPSATTRAGATGTEDRLVRIDPLTRRIAASIPVGRSPASLAVAEGSIWVIESSANSVARIDPVKNAIVDRIPVGKQPSAIVYDGGAIWVANQLDRSIMRIDPGSDHVTARIPVDGGPATLAAGDGVLLVGMSTEVGNSPPRIPIVLIREESREVVTTISVPGICPPRAAEAGGVAWTASSGGTLLRIDPRAGTVLKRSDLGVPISGITVANGVLWTGTDGLPAVVRSVDGEDLAVVAQVPVGNTANTTGASCDAIAIAVGSGSAWVTNGTDGTISQIAIDSRAVAHIVDVGKKPTGLALGFNALWVTVDAP